MGMMAGTNLYTLCEGDPLNFVDVFGLCDANFISKGDDAREGAEIIPSGGSQFTVATHGGAGGNGLFAKAGTPISAQQLIDGINADGHKPGQPILMATCYGGVGQNLDVMKQVAAAEHSDVIAATKEVFPRANGKKGAYVFVDLLVKDKAGPGAWVDISPNGTVSPYAGPICGK